MAPSHDIQAGIGPGWFDRQFGGAPFAPCLVELIKNTDDWGATSVFIASDDRALLVVRDNGQGMNRANRAAFLSVNMSTASAGQSGTFCTGTKRFLYSQATEVRVLTAPEEEPGFVYEFSFTTAEYERLALERGKLPAKRKKKSKRSWPFDHPFGTRLIYTLRDPSSRRILRGPRLAAELAARLPLDFRDILQVDGEPLPVKEVVGEVFVYKADHSQLGWVSVEVYRPKRRRPEEDLRLTGAQIGEAPMSSLYRVLGEYRDEFPTLLLLREVCGTISTPFLSEHAMETRTAIAASVTDDPRIVPLLAVLRELEPGIRRSLDIRTTDSEGNGVERDLKRVRDICNARYAGVRPSGSGDARGDGGEGGTASPISLRCGREFEVGEQIVVRARLRPDLRDRIDHLRWFTANARARIVDRATDRLTMIAAELGTGTVRADIAGTRHKVVRPYRIVSLRVFRLSSASSTVPVGASVTIHGVNADKLAGELAWSLTGAGEIEVGPSSVTFTAPRYPSQATIIGYDRSDPDARATCEITVRGVLDTLCIRGTHFNTEHYDAPGETAQPVTMVLGGDPHQIIVNTGAPGLAAARQAGMAPEFLLYALAAAYPRFRKFELDGEDMSGIDPHDLPVLLDGLSREGFVILQELLEKSD